MDIKRGRCEPNKKKNRSLPNISFQHFDLYCSEQAENHSMTSGTPISSIDLETIMSHPISLNSTLGESQERERSLDLDSDKYHIDVSTTEKKKCQREKKKPSIGRQRTSQRKEYKLEPDLNEDNLMFMTGISDGVESFNSDLNQDKILKQKSKKPPKGLPKANAFAYIKDRTIGEENYHDKVPQERCELCGSDIRYHPPGFESSRQDHPVVAILSCKHVFHDECLSQINPQGYTSEPPCFKCM